MIHGRRHGVIREFLQMAERVAPLALADRSWDNVGLLLESPQVRLVGPSQACRVLLTIDLTETVFEEAIAREASVILAYHPPWFRGEKSLTLDASRGMMRMVALCAAHGVSIYSPHSALDAIQGGINDHVAQVLCRTDDEETNILSCSPIKPSPPPHGAFPTPRQC